MNERNQSEEIEIDLKELFFVLLRKIWIILGVTAIGIISAILITVLAITPMYESTASLYILSKSTSITSLSDIQLGTQLTKDYMVLAKSHTVVEEVIDELSLDMTYEEFLSNVTISNESDTRILTLAVQNTDPYMAKMIVDKYAEVTANQTANIMATDVPNIVDSGIVADSPVSPSLVKNAAMGGMLCFLVVVAILIIKYLMNDAIQTSDDAEKYLGITNLGSIPVYQDAKNTRKHR